jgi:NADH:quinone reductase (non-electrogenic)
MPRIIVLGAGFAGLWAAIGAARKREEIGARAAELEILVVDRNPYHNIRVRNYEVDLSAAAIPLAKLLDPVGVKHLLADVQAIDLTNQRVAVAGSNGRETLAYDRLVLALGSELVRPAIPGLAEHAFDVDTYKTALRLDAHLAALSRHDPSDARSTVVVVGAGFTGIEVAAEMPARLDKAGVTGKRRIILVDPNPVVGAAIGTHGAPIVDEALTALGVETRCGVRVNEIAAAGIALSSGEFIAARDVAHGVLDGSHTTVMSCQFARPMGRYAGHNVVADLFGEPMLPLNIDWYVTVLDLGAWGALYTTGWDRKVRTTGDAAKLTKQTINHQRIYPPLNGSRDELFAAAAPAVQAPPTVRD